MSINYLTISIDVFDKYRVNIYSVISAHPKSLVQCGNLNLLALKAREIQNKIGCLNFILTTSIEYLLNTSIEMQALEKQFAGPRKNKLDHCHCGSFDRSSLTKRAIRYSSLRSSECHIQTRSSQFATVHD